MNFLHFSCTIWLDIFSIFPVNYLLNIWSKESYIRINRTLKVYRLFEFADWTLMRSSRPNVFRILKLIGTCIMLFHWNACIYLLISSQSATKGFEYFQI